LFGNAEPFVRVGVHRRPKPDLRATRAFTTLIRTRTTTPSTREGREEPRLTCRWGKHVGDVLCVTRHVHGGLARSTFRTSVYQLVDVAQQYNRSGHPPARCPRLHATVGGPLSPVQLDQCAIPNGYESPTVFTNRQHRPRPAQFPTAIHLSVSSRTPAWAASTTMADMSRRRCRDRLAHRLRPGTSIDDPSPRRPTSSQQTTGVTTTPTNNRSTSAQRPHEAVLPELVATNLSSALPAATFPTERTDPLGRRVRTWVVPSFVASPIRTRRSHRCSQPPWVDGSEPVVSSRRQVPGMYSRWRMPAVMTSSGFASQVDAWPLRSAPSSNTTATTSL